MKKLLGKIAAIVTAAAMAVTMFSLTTFAQESEEASAITVSAFWSNYTTVGGYSVTLDGNATIEGLSKPINGYENVKVNAVLSDTFGGGKYNLNWNITPNGGVSYNKAFPKLNARIVSLSADQTSVFVFKSLVIEASTDEEKETVTVNGDFGELELIDGVRIHEQWNGNNTARVYLDVSAFAKVFGDDTMICDNDIITISGTVSDYFKITRSSDFVGLKDTTESVLDWTYTTGSNAGWGVGGNGVYFDVKYQNNAFMMNGELPLFTTTDSEGNTVNNALTLTGTNKDGVKKSVIIPVPTLEFDDIIVTPTVIMNDDNTGTVTLKASTFITGNSKAPKIKYKSATITGFISDYFDASELNLTVHAYGSEAKTSADISISDKDIDLASSNIPCVLSINGVTNTNLIGSVSGIDTGYNVSEVTAKLSQDMIDSGYSFSSDEKVNEAKITFVSGQSAKAFPTVYAPDGNVEARVNWFSGDNDAVISELVDGDTVNCEIDAGKITFFDKDSNKIKTVYVFENETAVAPEAPIVDGYTFSAWLNVDGVASDLSSGTYDVYASYIQIPVNYTITIIPDVTDGGDVIIIPDDDSPAAESGEDIDIPDDDSAAGEGTAPVEEGNDNPYTGADDFSGVAVLGIVLGLSGVAAALLTKKRK